MLQLLIRIISSAGAVVTAGAFLATVPGIPGIGKVLLWALMIGVGGVTVADVMSYAKRRPQTFPLQSPGIVEFMSTWLSSGGRSAVFSHDLSWVAPGSAILGTLERKAKAGELQLFVGRTPNVVTQLARAGAMVFDYSKLKFMPRSRFTIVDKDKAGARMAIGLAEGGQHVIRQYASSDHAIMALAEDFVHLAELVAERVP